MLSLKGNTLFLLTPPPAQVWRPMDESTHSSLCVARSSSNQPITWSSTLVLTSIAYRFDWGCAKGFVEFLTIIEGTLASKQSAEFDTDSS